ncbi:MAG: endonuclease III [Ignavibacteria bacterium]|nr:endonuclease III [Ignavibacteria bacterium]
MAVKSKELASDLTADFILKVNNILLKKFGKPPRNFNSNPLDILVATILSQNTNDLNSHKAFVNLKNEFQNYDELIEADLRQIEKLIRIAGLGKQKARTIKKFLISLKKKNKKLDLDFLKNYSIDEALDFLVKHDGIGIKTAACVLLFGLNKNVCPVDTHVHRVINRLGIVKTKNRDKTFEELKKHLPNGIAHEFHTNLIKLGRIICLSQNPKCYECPLKKLCLYEHKNLEKPKMKNKAPTKNSDFMLLDSV